MTPRASTHEGVYLSGDMAARILDMAGIVVNRNTIPGDKGALNPTGLRLGTVWISQLGFGDAEVDLLAEAIATVLQGLHALYLCRAGRQATAAGQSKIIGPCSSGRELVRQLRGRHRSNDYRHGRVRSRTGSSQLPQPCPDQ